MPELVKSLRTDYAPPPGDLLDEVLAEHDMSARELARRCGRSPKLMAEIVSAKAALEPETALQLERVLGIEASIWLGLESEYRLHIARKAEDSAHSENIQWAKSFPLSDLHKRGILTSAKASGDAVRELLQFFGVGSISAWNNYCDSVGLAYRHSATYDSDRSSLFAWLRLGELKANSIECKEFDRAALVAALQEIRSLTLNPNIEEFLPAIQSKLAQSGVAFVVLKPFSGTALSGVSRWLSPKKALIQQTLRHMSDDHFWFTLLHEAAHILLHSRKTVFVDGRQTASGTNDEENEANKWATDFLVPRSAMAKFLQSQDFSAQSVKQFSREVGVAPGIVVGQLQKLEAIPYSSQLNHLKQRFEWVG